MIQGYYNGERSLYQETTGHLRRLKPIQSRKYIEDLDYGRSDTKNTEREKVAEWLLGAFPLEFSEFRAITMPGSSWSFENIIRLSAPETAESPKGGFVGVEIDCNILNRYAVNMMPVGCPAKLKCGEFAYGSAMVPHAWVYNNRMINLKVSDLFSMLQTDFGQSINQMQSFVQMYLSNTASWLDFTSPFCAEVDKAVSLLHFGYKPAEVELPFAITTMLGRDKGISGGLAGRAKRIQELNGRLSVEKAWSYSGLSGARMATFCGVVKPEMA